jgi:ribonuclease VapC
MNSFVLDSSAIIALLNQEPGAKRVEDVLAFSMVSSVNVAEVLTKSVEAGHTVASATRTFKILKLKVVDFDLPHAILTAELRPLTRTLGLSLGDRACLALAISKGATALTADRIWNTLNLCPVELIR